MPSNNQIQFAQKLVLQQWLFNLLGVDQFSTLQDWLKDSEFEGFDTENRSNFYNELSIRLSHHRGVTDDDLMRYDNNIVRHWKQITEKRNQKEGRILYPKYFQYLALLATEIYLERYFDDPNALLLSLNEVVDDFNADQPDREKLNGFLFSELNKLAFWMATGSGKTLLMHCNLLQYKHYLKQKKAEKTINRVLLLTPNEGLSRQHLAEFGLSGINAEIFSKKTLGSMFSGASIEIIDIHKLGETNGDKTVDVAAFEGNNLVLVDEGHSGASGGEAGKWMRRREALCANGFSIEYSATFGQAIRNDSKLIDTYAKSILFDYSYRYFYTDGYGKEYRILNLQDDSHDEQRYRYLSACLLAFYQQQKVFQGEKISSKQYLIEKPLWIFVGGSVNAVSTRRGKKVSDVVDILLFLARLADPDQRSNNTRLIEDFLRGNAGLLDSKGYDIFENSFTYLTGLNLSAEQIYQNILETFFNVSSPAKLYVENLKGSDGEIGLRLGDNDYFGLINVGDANALCNLCEEFPELVVREEAVSSSIFHQLERPDSEINVLIGSRKFMEGWNSWRVSTMGLMNIGRGEGSQIIQLFGRGVRLKGKEFSLKRSSALDETHTPRHIPILETLNIFGVRADYMQQFKEYLEAEGISPEGEKIEFIMPVINDLGKQKLKMIRLQEGLDFKHDGPRPTLGLPDEKLRRKPVDVNWYPRVQALTSNSQTVEIEAELHTEYFSAPQTAFLNVDELFFALQQFKNERGWYNLNISREGIEKLLNDRSWYKLYIPEGEFSPSRFMKVDQWQEIMTALLKKYCDRFYKHKKAEWEGKHLEYRELTPDDPNFFQEYKILYDKSREDIGQRLEAIKKAIEEKQLQNMQFERLNILFFDRHLYHPLLYLGKGCQLEVSPVALNEGEKNFVEDLKTFFTNPDGYFQEKELYLLRNRSKGNGVGFFEAGNFYPDFIMWLVVGEKQYVSFIDPKGISRIGLADPKVEFFQTIKDLEKDLNDPNIILNSFIVSNSEFNTLPIQVQNMSKEDWEAKNVFFQKEDRETYIEGIIERIGVE
jgi:hypothetical protein